MTRVAADLDPALLDALRQEVLRTQWELAQAKNRAEEAQRQYLDALRDERDDRRAAMLAKRAEKRR